MKTFVLLSILISFHASAEIFGKGAGVQKCVQPSHQASTYEFYDSWEGKNFHLPRLNLAAWDGIESKDQILSRVLNKIGNYQPGVKRDLLLAMEALNDPKVIIDASDTRLVREQSAGGLLKQEDCNYLPVLNILYPGEYTPKSMLMKLIDLDLYQKLNPRDQAMLDLHAAAILVVHAYQNKTLEKYGTNTIRAFIEEAFSSSSMIAPLVEPVKIDPGIYRTTGKYYDTLTLVPFTAGASNGFETVKMTFNYIDGSLDHLHLWTPVRVDGVQRTEVELNRGSSAVFAFNGNYKNSGKVINADIHKNKWETLHLSLQISMPGFTQTLDLPDSKPNPSTCESDGVGAIGDGLKCGALFQLDQARLYDYQSMIQ